MAESITTKIKKWVKKTMSAMGDALLSEKSKTIPPDSGEQPYKDTPKKGLFWIKKFIKTSKENSPRQNH